jgi:CheY-like chemotaxis protein
MDWRMPGLDGLQTARLLRADAALVTQPAVVMVTAFNGEEVKEAAGSLDLDGFMVKPVSKSMVLDTLVNLFADSTTSEGIAGRTSGHDEDHDRCAGARILLTEDNEINQQIATELLEDAGAQVTVANNGREAVELLLANPTGFDLVFMDLQMPEMDGHQATIAIRNDARFTDLPIIAMTAHASQEERARCLAEGMNDHITKPIAPAVLFATIEKYYTPAQAAAVRAARAAEGGLVAASESPTLGAALPSIPELDVDDGLSRVAGNVELYTKLLRRFVTQDADVAARISGSLASGDRANAERLAHTIRGVAGSLGAAAAQAAAEAVESALRTGSDAADIASRISTLAAAMATLCERLGPAYTAASGTARETPVITAFTPATDRPVAERMLQRLADFEVDAAEDLEAHRDLFRALLGDEPFARFETHVQGFALADAHALLRAALEALP